MWHFLYLSAGSRVGPTGPTNTVTTLRGLRTSQGKDGPPPHPGEGNHASQAALPGGMGVGDKVAQQESQKALPSQLPRHKKPDSSRGPDPFQIYIPLPVARHCSPTSGCSASSLVSLSPVPTLEQSGWWSLGLQLTSPAFVILSGLLGQGAF